MDGKESIKLSFFLDCMIVYVENPKKSVIRLMELISEFWKVPRYKVYTHMSYFYIVVIYSWKLNYKKQYHLLLG